MSYIRVCPECGSTKTQQTKDNPLFGAMGAPATYECLACGFRAPIFPEIDESKTTAYIEETGKHEGVAENIGEQVDTTYGKILFRVIWKITSIPLIILGILGSVQGQIEGVIYLFLGLSIGYFAWIRTPVAHRESN